MEPMVPYKCSTASSATQVRIKAEDRVDDMSSIREGEKRASLPRKEHSNSVNRKCNSHWATSTLRSAVPEGRDLGKVSRAKVELQLLNEGTKSNDAYGKSFRARRRGVLRTLLFLLPLNHSG